MLRSSYLKINTWRIIGILQEKSAERENRFEDPILISNGAVTKVLIFEQAAIFVTSFIKNDALDSGTLLSEARIFRYGPNFSIAFPFHHKSQIIFRWMFLCEFSRNPSAIMWNCPLQLNIWNRLIPAVGSIATWNWLWLRLLFEMILASKAFIISCRCWCIPATAS